MHCKILSPSPLLSLLQTPSPPLLSLLHKRKSVSIVWITQLLHSFPLAIVSKLCVNIISRPFRVLVMLRIEKLHGQDAKIQRHTRSICCILRCEVQATRAPKPFDRTRNQVERMPILCSWVTLQIKSTRHVRVCQRHYKIDLRSNKTVTCVRMWPNTKLRRSKDSNTRESLKHALCQSFQLRQTHLTHKDIKHLLKQSTLLFVQ